MMPPEGMNELVGGVDRMVQDQKFAGVGDRIVIVAGAAMGTPGTLNGIVIHTVGEPWNGQAEPAVAGEARWA